MMGQDGTLTTSGNHVFRDAFRHHIVLSAYDLGFAKKLNHQILLVWALDVSGINHSYCRGQ